MAAATLFMGTLGLGIARDGAASPPTWDANQDKTPH